MFRIKPLYPFPSCKIKIQFVCGSHAPTPCDNKKFIKVFLLFVPRVTIFFGGAEHLFLVLPSIQRILELVLLENK